jgi:hypothetical protein
MPRNSLTTIRCNCGSVVLELAGKPIITSVCYCDDCQAGAGTIEALPNAAPVRDPDGGTAYVIYRKDRVKCVAGAELLKSYKLDQKTATNRVVASCCNSAMMLNFDDSKHWVDVYRKRFTENAPPVEMRVCTRFAPGNLAPADGVPSYPGFAPRFIVKLLAARLAMLIGR